MASTDGTVNLGPRGRRQRTILGGVMVLLTAAAVALGATYDVARGLRLLVFLPLFVGALSWFQAAAAT